MCNESNFDTIPSFALKKENAKVLKEQSYMVQRRNKEFKEKCLSLDTTWVLASISEMEDSQWKTVSNASRLSFALNQSLKESCQTII